MCINCHSLRSVLVVSETTVIPAYTWHNLFCEDSSIFRSFESSFHRNFVSLGDFSIDLTNFLRKCFKFSKKDCEILFKISLKIRENKRRISTKFALITFAQYCTLPYYCNIDDTKVILYYCIAIFALANVRMCTAAQYN